MVAKLLGSLKLLGLLNQNNWPWSCLAALGVH